MILHALTDYYDRRAADPASDLAPEGFEPKAIPFVLVLDSTGHLQQLADRRTGEGRKRSAVAVLVPQGVKKTSGVAANLLWDTAEYVLGIDTKGKPARVAEQHAAFVNRVLEFCRGVDDPGLAAVLAFLEHHRPAALATLAGHPDWPEIIATNPLLSFELIADTQLVCQRPAVIRALTGGAAAAADGVCLVRGEADCIERLHPAIKGVWGAQTAGANIVSFNLDAFNSYGKTQSFNAPVGKRAAFAYTTALNHLLAKGSRQRLQVGDTSTVFWAERASGAPFEAAFLDFFDPRNDPTRGTQAVASLYRCVRDGRPWTADGSDAEQRFYVLGLAPNAARLAVRFWYVESIANLGARFYRYFDELDIVRPAYAIGAPLPLLPLLTTTAAQGKADNIAPNLAGDMMRAILEGRPYPQTLLQGVLRRIRAEHDISWPRAALLKAYLNRNHHDQEITVSLNPQNLDPGYRLGRLFAALERVQERAQGKLNAGIRDRYYGAFSATPQTVLPLLMKLKNHHLTKLSERGEAVNLEKLFAEIIDGLGEVPVRLSLAQQAGFAVGYYHQRQAFFTKSDSAGEDPNAAQAEVAADAPTGA